MEALDAGMSQVKAAKKFECGRAQCANILKNRQEILRAYCDGSKSTTAMDEDLESENPPRHQTARSI